MFICQVLCSVFKHLFSIHCGRPSAKVGSSAKFCVLVFRASLFYDLGGLDLPGDLPRPALTIILHITPGKYEPS